MSVKIRNLRKGEQLPQALQTGFECAANTNFDWIWVAEHEDRITAILITTPAHVAVLLMRLLSTDDAEVTDVRALLASACIEMKLRGYNGYFTWLDPSKEIEHKLLDIFVQAGGIQFPDRQVLCMGAV